MKVSIIIPVYKGESTIVKTLDSLTRQSVAFSELLIFNDGSPDNSAIIISEYLKKKNISNSKLINHKKPLGLAAIYNEGMKLSKSEFVVTLHQDVILMRNSLERLIKPFEKNNPRIVASYHVVLHPVAVWNKYNFWQKVFFSRLVNRKFYGLDGKFDCFRKSAVERVGYFDSIYFRTVGEDGEMISKLKKIGTLVATESRIIHLHQNDNNFSVSDIIKKQGQYSEAQGVMLRLGVIRSVKQIVSAFFREILLLSLVFPYLRIISICLIVLYSLSYTGRAIKKEWKNPRVVILSFLNFALLFVSLYFSARGFINGKQKI